MPRPVSRPVFVIVPGASQTPSHYAHLIHLLQSHGHPTLSSMLPSTGTGANVTVQDDADYIRSRMILPILEVEKHDVILIMHSYRHGPPILSPFLLLLVSFTNIVHFLWFTEQLLTPHSGLPGSAAALGLGKEDRTKEGKSTSVLGQIFISSMLAKGGEGKDVVATFGGQLPPHLIVNEAKGLIECEDPASVLLNDVASQAESDALVLSSLCPSLASFTSPCPRSSWDSPAFKGRLAFVRTLKDLTIPPVVQDMMIAGTSQEFIVKDLDAGHNAQIVAPEKLLHIFIEMTKKFEEL
ncbi:hypothetical protein BP6252_04895 [Coleophoma cylindrospora]|uniref:AB hydrolase-1 domain-containing protein n=1 Tax=Coleophoma cylindrospora TaxID=1849047 RepID=A0A3D8S1T3_9HELO|nr:hypothetical protein BP6252_04895 [Coleophoma cylindrospora]